LEGVCRSGTSINETGGTRNVKRVIRWLAWCGLAAIVGLSLVPAALQTSTPLPAALEHGAAYFVAALVFCIAYPKAHQRLLVVLALIVAAVVLELLQLPRADRTATVTDVIGSAAGAIAGALAARVLDRVGRFVSGFARRSRRKNNPRPGLCGSDPARSTR
jgi:VanZ family protein